MSLHVLAAIYCSLGRFEEAVPVLEQAIQVPQIGRGPDHALAAFSGHMQLGDTYSMLGQIERSIGCYEEGLKIQIEALGETDPRVGETCRFGFFCSYIRCRFVFPKLWEFVAFELDFEEFKVNFVEFKVNFGEF